MCSINCLKAFRQRRKRSCTRFGWPRKRMRLNVTSMSFVRLYEAKYPKAAECLQQDHDVLLTFYDFPTEHWRHIRTTNPIESTFATVRLRTNKVRGCFSAQTVITMAFELCQCAQKRWIRLHHPQRLAEVIRGVKFVNSVEEKRIAA